MTWMKWWDGGTRLLLSEEAIARQVLMDGYRRRDPNVPLYREAWEVLMVVVSVRAKRSCSRLFIWDPPVSPGRSPSTPPVPKV